MNRTGVLPAFLALGLLFAARDSTAEKWTKGRMSVFVFARTVEDSTDAKAILVKPAKAALDVADTQLKDLERDLKSRHGGKRERWPEDARASFEQASHARRRAFDRWLDLFQTQQALDRSAESLRGKMFSKSVEHTTPATGPEDADLTVEVVRAPSAERDALSLRIAPGGRVDESKLGGAQFEFRSANVSEVHAFNPVEPHWEIEVLGDRSFPAHAWANSGIGGFIRRHWDVIVAARRP